jgi:hypothetical protein
LELAPQASGAAEASDASVPLARDAELDASRLVPPLPPGAAAPVLPPPPPAALDGLLFDSSSSPFRDVLDPTRSTIGGAAGRFSCRLRFLPNFFLPGGCC